MTGRYEDLLSAGVADPCQVSRCALQTAVSIAGVVLSSNHSSCVGGKNKEA